MKVGILSAPRMATLSLTFLPVFAGFAGGCSSAPPATTSSNFVFRTLDPQVAVPTDAFLGRTLDDVFSEIVADPKAYDKETRQQSGGCQADMYLSKTTPRVSTYDFVRLKCADFELVSRGYRGPFPFNVDDLELQSDEFFADLAFAKRATKVARVSWHAKTDAKGNVVFDYQDRNSDGKIDRFTLPTGDALDRNAYERIGFVVRGSASLTASSFQTLSRTDSNFDGLADIESAVGIAGVVVEWPADLKSPEGLY